jgi:hypothetical protein
MSIYSERPWLKHYDYWVRPHMPYPGKPLYEILASAIFVIVIVFSIVMLVVAARRIAKSR